MKILLFEYNPIWESIDENINQIKEELRKFDKDIDLIIFPELTLTGFTMQPSKYADSLNYTSNEFFANLAKEYKTNIIYGQIVRKGALYYNASIHLDRSGDKKGIYYKIHPFSYSDENKYYASGNEPIVTIIDGFKFGLTICYDLRFPELYRQYGKSRVDAIVNIANWPIPRIEHWKALLRARAIENLCYVFGVNRTGKDPNVEYNGNSMAYSPLGEICQNTELYSEISGSNSPLAPFYIDVDMYKTKEVQDKFKFLDDIKLI